MGFYRWDNKYLYLELRYKRIGFFFKGEIISGTGGNGISKFIV
jgi:hypothetical protein